VTDARPRPLAAAAPAALVAAATALASFAAQGSLAIAAAPAAAVLAGAALLVVPARLTAAALLLAVLLLDVPANHPAAALWRSPLARPAEMLFDNLRHATGIDALRFSALDVLIVGLLAAATAQRARDRAAGRRAVDLPPGCVTAALAAAVAAVLVLEARGLARGGDLKSSLWQIRPLLAAPLAAGAYALSLRGPSDLRVLGRVVVAVACLKAAIGLYVLAVVAPRAGVARPAYVTTHDDSMLFVLALALLGAAWYEARTWRAAWALALAGPWIALGMWANNRRIAWVGASLVALLLLLVARRTPLKRAVVRAGAVVLPLAALYVAAGWNATGGVFAPVAMARSVVDPASDASTEWRHVENRNLARTFLAAPLLGSGFGHPYVETERGADISSIFPLYGFLPHNSVLGLWAFGGLLGFACLAAPLVVAAFLAFRAYPRARRAEERVAAMGVLAALVVFLVQAWGDIGWHSAPGGLLVAVAVAAAARLAPAVGAWPDAGEAREPAPGQGRAAA
jgi:O-antigen ligase